MPNHNQTSLQLLAIFILFLYILQPAFAHNKNKTSDGSKNSSGGGGGSVGGSGNVQVSVSLKGSFSQVIAFGDSYTDTGNCMFMNGLRRFFGGIIANSPYGSIFKSPKNGNRFCDGRLVIDFLCEALGLPHLPPYKDPKVNVSGGVNFAVSGSTSLTSELFSKYKIGQGLLWKSMVSQNFLTQLDWFDEFIQKMVASGGGGWGTGSQRGSGQIGGGSSGGFGGGGSGGGGFGGGGGAGGGGAGGFGGGGGNIGGFGGGGGSTGGFGGGGASGFGGGGGNTGGFGGGIIGGGSGSGQIGGGASGSSGGQIGGSGQGGGSASGSGQIGGTGSGQAGGGASGSGQIGGSGGGHTGGGASGSGQIGGNGGGQASGGQASGGQAGGSTSGSGQIGGGASGSGQIGGSGGGQAGGSASGNGQIGGSGGGQAGGGASGSGGGKAGGGASGSGHIGGSGGGQAGGGASGSGQIGGSGGGQAAGGASGSGQISGGGNGQTSIDFSKILVWIGEMGVNDYARIITSSSLTGNWFSQISVNQVAKILTGVLEKGAKYLVVQGLPPVGCLPIALSHVPNSDRDEHGCSASINNLVKLHNQLLQKKITELQGQHKDCVISYADYYSAYITIMTNVTVYQVQEPLKACCGASSGAFNFSPKQLCGAGSTGKCSDPSKYIVWDGLHLTEAMHKHLAELFFDKGYCHPSIPEMIAQKNKSLLDMLVDGSFAVPDDILQHLHFELQLYFVWRSIFAGGLSW